MRFRALLVVALLAVAVGNVWSLGHLSAQLAQMQTQQATIAYAEGVFTIDFPRGATFISVVFESTKEDYTPRKNSMLEEELTRVTEDWSMINCYMGGPTDCSSGADWRVWAEIQYENPDHSYRELKTNVLVVKH